MTMMVGMGMGMVMANHQHSAVQLHNDLSKPLLTGRRVYLSLYIQVP